MAKFWHMKFEHQNCDLKSTCFVEMLTSKLATLQGILKILLVILQFNNLSCTSRGGRGNTWPYTIIKYSETYFNACRFYIITESIDIILYLIYSTNFKSLKINDLGAKNQNI